MPPRLHRPRNQRGEGARLRDEILDAATRLLAASASADAVTIRAVAHAVGVTPPSVYLHFPDKDALLLSVCEAQFEVLGAAIEEQVAGIEDPIEQLVERGVSYVRFGLEHPEQYRMLFMLRSAPDPEPHEYLRLLEGCGLGDLQRNVERLHEAELLVGDDVLGVTLNLWLAVHGLTSALIAKPGFPWPAGPDQLARSLAETMLRGVLR